ncbi:DEAD/DEAH box helicase family protein [Paenibacillus sp. PCH8]|uniref:DEAD/DEAH box helicase family protein n=1 Tax=Paenibacillus sp. PCH8 TaxID=2066524 RepID=UPI0035BE5C55
MGLSAAQSAAAAAALAFLARPPAGDGPGRFLLWAVTGAGKTEMIFPLLQHTLDRGGRALVATPRRDVVLELAPRLAKAFPGTPIATLYGAVMNAGKKHSSRSRLRISSCVFIKGLTLLLSTNSMPILITMIPCSLTRRHLPASRTGISYIYPLHHLLVCRRKRHRANSLMPKFRYVSTVILYLSLI